MIRRSEVQISVSATFAIDIAFSMASLSLENLTIFGTPAKAPQPMELHKLEELSATCENCDQKLATLFKSRDDMMRWIAWLSKPEKPAGQSGKVVDLKKPH